ncbi:hypothetical protein KEF85_09980 [Methylomonas paludis]|uniref:Uncharacterized protein n=1 Tax=Methylomonas paludis TaxID=1173101 RepID=A0A975MLB6_9GAMM|nr:hypothetical protein [Methylomonas paludis]QWF69704.1 hypothetical protein KEF85_09980 [Methylomonas paludis]
MARPYSHTQFFRRVPNALLARYFQDKHGVLLDVDFTKLKETEVELVFKGFNALSEEKHLAIEAECQNIDGMTCKGGITALADEAGFHLDSHFLQAIEDTHG